jgi:hypothetical protein
MLERYPEDSTHEDALYLPEDSPIFVPRKRSVPEESEPLSAQGEPTSVLRVDYIPDDATAEDVERVLVPFGRVQDVHIRAFRIRLSACLC